MGALARESPARTFILRGLTREEIAKLAATTHGRELSEPAVARLYEKTDGNPLFVTQLLHALHPDAHDAARESARGGATSAVLSRDVMRDAIALHLGELTPPCVRVLEVAAVLGRTFTLATLSGTAGMETSQLLPVLDEAIRARVVARPPSGGTKHRFVHALVRDVLYRRLSVTERVRLHGAAGEAILARTGSPEGEALDAVATHFAEAAAGGNVGRAIEWCLRAAERAEQLDDALEHLERAMAAVAFASPADPAAIASLDRELTALAARAPALADRAEAARRSIHRRR